MGKYFWGYYTECSRKKEKKQELGNVEDEERVRCNEFYVPVWSSGRKKRETEKDKC